VSLVFAAGLGRFLDVRITTRRAPRLHVGLVQATLPAEAKRRDPVGYAEQYIELSSIVRDPIDVLIWPETALALPVPANVRDMNEAHPSLARVRAPLITGAVTRDGDRVYNSALLFDANRRLAGRVDKQKLLPFAERIPFGESLPQLYALIPGAGRFSPGTGAPILVLPHARVATFICYEDMLPDLVRRAAVDGRADVLVSLTNDAWFGKSRAAYTHYAVAKLRAIELRRSLVRATNTGVTAIIDPTGAITTIAPEHHAATAIARVPLMTGQTVYARWGYAPLAGIVLTWLAIAALRRARALNRSPQANRSSRRDARR
jgi:apolipoprotein N-acyltransferase